MKKLLFLISIVSFFSCEQIEKLDKQMDADSTDVANAISDIKAEMAIVEHLAKEGQSVLLIKAFGTEPGWFMEIYPTYMKVVLNYGQDSLLISDDFEDAGNDKGFEYTADNEKGNVVVKIKTENCTDEGKGDTHNRYVEFSVHGKQFKGCGDAIKE